MTQFAPCVDLHVDDIFLSGIHFSVLFILSHLLHLSQLQQMSLLLKFAGGVLMVGNCSEKPDYFAVCVNRNLSRLSLQPPQALCFYSVGKCDDCLFKHTVTTVIAKDIEGECGTSAAIGCNQN